MRNKFKYCELVKVNGIGKIYGKVKNNLERSDNSRNYLKSTTCDI